MGSLTHDTDLSVGPMGELCASFVQFCDTLRGHRSCPRRADFDITKLASWNARLVPHLWVLDIEPPRYRYTVIGGALVDAGAIARPGTYVDDFDKSGGLAARLDAAAAAMRPNWRRGPPSLQHDQEVLEVEVVLMPFTDANGKVTSFVNCSVYYWQPGFQPAWQTPREKGIY